MDKYAVETEIPEEDGTKQGSTPTCPICNVPAERAGNVWRCPTHGTKPFEKKDSV